MPLDEISYDMFQIFMALYRVPLILALAGAVMYSIADFVVSASLILRKQGGDTTTT